MVVALLSNIHTNLLSVLQYILILTKKLLMTDHFVKSVMIMTHDTPQINIRWVICLFLVGTLWFFIAKRYSNFRGNKAYHKKFLSIFYSNVPPKRLRCVEMWKRHLSAPEFQISKWVTFSYFSNSRIPNSSKSWTTSHATKSNTFFIHETIDVCMLIQRSRPIDEILNYCSK